jgi:hypothetical protein
MNQISLASIMALAASTLAASAASVSFNSGSLGVAANGTDANGVTFGAGAVAAGGDQAAYYNNTSGVNTVVPFNGGINPSSANPFTIEFWAYPTAWDNDDAPIANRVSASPRSGWAFFQRGEAEGWNLRMYNGSGSDYGWDLTGGTSALNVWTHVAATWDGSAAKLYVNGILADDSNNPTKNGVYNASTTANLTIASSDSGSPFSGGVDEVAFYASVLSPSQIASHYSTASSGAPGAYHNLVLANGASLLLSNNGVIPEPSSAALLAIGALALGRRRR